MFVLPWEKFRVPFDPGNRVAELVVKLPRSVGLPRIVESVCLLEINLDKVQEFDWLGSHLRTRRRSNSESDNRFVRPAW